jgi:hypothetical protein
MIKCSDLKAFSEFNHLLIFHECNFEFFTAFPKYFYSSNFSRDLLAMFACFIFCPAFWYVSLTAEPTNTPIAHSARQTESPEGKQSAYAQHCL